METHDWEHFAHEADVGLRGRGKTLAEAFSQVALALMAVVTDPDTVEPTHMVPIKCEAPDAELLLVDWLNALIYEMSTRHMVFSRFEVEIEDGQLQAKAWGEPWDKERHTFGVEAKGATYTELKVFEDNGCWHAQTVVDV